MSIVITPKILAGLILCQTALIVGGVLASNAESEVNLKQSGMSNTQQEKLDQAASGSLFGQFRTSMADFLWMKTDKYLHNGIDLRGMTEGEKKEKLAQIQKAKDDGTREHSNETTVVPAAQHDWRSFYGAWEREIQPYKNLEHHEHADPAEAIPLFRLMTISNPHFISGYTVGGMMMVNIKGKEADGIAFLKEGVKNNPDSMEILVALGGNFYTSKQKDFATALPYLTKAISIGKSRDVKTMTDDELEAFTGAYRWTILCYREQKDYAQARFYAKECLTYFPNDVTAVHFLKEFPH